MAETMRAIVLRELGDHDRLMVEVDYPRLSADAGHVVCFTAYYRAEVARWAELARSARVRRIEG